MRDYIKLRRLSLACDELRKTQTRIFDIALNYGFNNHTSHFASWQLPAREYVVCEYEAENFHLLMASLGKMMKFTRFWLKKHGLTADGFFPEIYYTSRRDAYMEMWIPFKKREKT